MPQVIAETLVNGEEDQEKLILAILVDDRAVRSSYLVTRNAINKGKAKAIPT